MATGSWEACRNNNKRIVSEVRAPLIEALMRENWCGSEPVGRNSLAMVRCIAVENKEGAIYGEERVK